MKIGDALKYCYRLNEAGQRGKINIQNLIAMLKNYEGPDISLDRYNQVVYAINTSNEYIAELLQNLEIAGISRKVNADVYKILWRLLVYRGFETDNFNSLNNLLKNRDKRGLRISELPVCQKFSVIEKAARKLATDTSDRNDILASELANITGQTKGTNRGKCEVLLGIVSRKGNIVAQTQSDAGKGDVIVDGKPIEVKCSMVQGKSLTLSNIAGSAGRLGNAGHEGYKAVNEVRSGLVKIMKDYYKGLTKYANNVNPVKLMKEMPEAFNLNTGSGTMIDHYLLMPLSYMSIKNQAALRTYIIDTYKQIFLNFFSDSAVGFMESLINPVISAKTRGRTLNKMIAEARVISQNEYDNFQKIIGCCYLKLYQSIENFKGLLVISLKSNRNSEVLTDESIFIDEALLKDTPVSMAKKVAGSGLQFIWPRLDKSARQAAVMGIAVV